MKISRKQMTKKIAYVHGRLSRNMSLSCAELQRRVKARFGQGMGHWSLVGAINSFFASR